MIFLAYFVASVAAISDEKCYALAFSSGDENSAYQAGVLKGIASSTLLDPKERAYDAVSGVSGGAINTVLLSAFDKGQEAEASDRMEQFWLNATNNTLYKNWLGGIARGFIFEGGLYNSAPLETFLKKEFTDLEIKRSFNIGITDVINGTYKSFSEKDI